MNCQASCRLVDFSVFQFTILQDLFTFRLHSLSLSFFLLACRNPRMTSFLTDNLRHAWHLIDFKRFFLAKTLAKTCQRCRQNGKSLILKEFLFVKCVMSLFYKYLWQIIIKSYCSCACRLLLICALAAYLCAATI